MAIKKLRNITISGRGIYYFAFLYYYVISFLRFTTFTPIISINLLNRLSYLAIVLLLLKIYVFDGLELKSQLIYSVIIFLAFLSWRNSQAVDILVYTLFILGAKNVDFYTIISYFFKIGVIMLLLTVVYSQFGIIKDSIYIRGNFSRHSMGINYPTDFAAHIFSLILAYFYLYFKRITWRSYLGVVIISMIMYALTQARLDVIVSLLTIPVMMIAKRAYKKNSFSKVIASFYWIVAPTFSYITVISAIFYSANNHLFRIVNNLVSKRLEISHLAFEKYGISLFGRRVIEHGFGGNQGFKQFYQSGMSGGYFYIDSSFIRLAIIYGLIMLLFVIIVVTLIGMRSVSVQGYCLAGIMLLLTVSCIIEQHILDISYNPFLVAFLASNAYYCNLED